MLAKMLSTRIIKNMRWRFYRLNDSLKRIKKIQVYQTKWALRWIYFC